MCTFSRWIHLFF